MIKALKWISVLGPVLTIVGAASIAIAIRAYPHSNVLGGWALILGPIYWLGLFLCVFAIMGWIIVGLRTAIRLIASTRTKNRDNCNSENQP